MKTPYLLALWLGLSQWQGLSAGTERIAAATAPPATSENPVWTRLLQKAASLSTADWITSGSCPCPVPSAANDGPPAPGSGTKPQPLPPLDPGTTELKFGEFFTSPIGPRGLELTKKLRGLKGKRVRLLGYMVREEQVTIGRLLLTPFPVQLHSHDCALADDLPPSTVHVVVPQAGNRSLPYTPKLLLLTGILNLGAQVEPDGRTSLVRLIIDETDTARNASETVTKNNPRDLINQPTSP